MATHKVLTRGLLIRLVVIALAVSAVAFVGSRWTVSAAPLLQAVPQEVLDLKKEPNIRINGITLQDRSGGNLAVGDINNDGVDDLILGGHLADPIGRAQAGMTFVVFGPLETGTIELSQVVDITVNGVADFDHSGRAVATGDINNDGAADLIIGAFDADVRGEGNVGTTYVLFGPLGAGQLELAVDPDIIVNGINAHDLSGTGVGSGDINNDGADDLIIGAPQANTDEIHAGQTYVVFGPLEAGSLELSTSADLTVNGDLLNQNTGSTLASGDVNNDGADDLIIGADNASPGGVESGGITYVLFGPLGPGTLDARGDADVTLNGIDRDDHSGIGLGAGDVNNDGVVDLLIGAAEVRAANRFKAGQSYVIYGPLTPGTVELSTGANVIYNGASNEDRSGVGLATGDMNNDGQQDLIIASWYASPGGRNEVGQTSVMLYGIEAPPAGIIAGGGSSLILIVGAVVVLVVAALVLWLVLRGRGSRGDAEEGAIGPTG